MDKEIKRKFQLKAIDKIIEDGDERIIEGWLSTDDVDRGKEITLPGAFKRSLKELKETGKLFFGHETWKEPVGNILDIKIKEHGVWIKAKISETEDKIWAKVKEGILSTLSFGYRLLKYEMNEKTGVLTILDMDVYEATIAPIPMNPKARVEFIKSMGMNIPNLESMNKEENMDEKELRVFISAMEMKIDAIPKAFTQEEAKKALSDIHTEVAELKKKGDLSPEALKELQDKSSADLLAAFAAFEKNIEQKWVTPPKMVHDTESIEQAKRLGNLTDFKQPEVFKKALIDINVEKAAASIGILNKQYLLKELQEASDDLMIVGAVMRMTEGTPEGPLNWKRGVPTHLKTFQKYQRLLAEFHKALDTGTSGEGSDWLPTGMSATLIADMEIERGLGRRMPRFAQPTKAFVWPLKTSGATAYIVSEAQNDSNANTFTASTPGTSSITFTAVAMGAAIFTSDEEVEDSIIPILPFIRTELATALRDGEENAIINGDNATTHQDTDIAALGSSAIAKIFDGLRLDAIANAKYDISGTLTYAKMLSTLKKSGKWGTAPGVGFWVVSVDAYYFMLGLTEFTGYNVFSNMAVAGTGALPRAIGHEVVPSAQMRNDLGPVGVNAASDNVHTGILYVNPKGYMIGDRKIYTVESDRLVLTGQEVIVAKQRIDMQKMATSSATPCSMGYNITTAG